MTSENLLTLRTEYLDAAIAEITCVANCLTNDEPEKATWLKRIAQLAGDHAQAKYVAFLNASIDENPGCVLDVPDGVEC